VYTLRFLPWWREVAAENLAVVLQHFHWRQTAARRHAAGFVGASLMHRPALGGDQRPSRLEPLRMIAAALFRMAGSLEAAQLRLVGMGLAKVARTSSSVALGTVPMHCAGVRVEDLDDAVADRSAPTLRPAMRIWLRP
jgi:hypothetical protein